MSFLFVKIKINSSETFNYKGGNMIAVLGEFILEINNIILLFV